VAGWKIWQRRTDRVRALHKNWLTTAQATKNSGRPRTQEKGESLSLYRAFLLSAISSSSSSGVMQHNVIRYLHLLVGGGITQRNAVIDDRVLMIGNCGYRGGEVSHHDAQEELSTIR
jgi:hypothetical protein